MTQVVNRGWWYRPLYFNNLTHFWDKVDIVYVTLLFAIMSLLRHSILRQSLLRHSILRQSLLRHLLLRLLILRQWPIVFAILALLAIQMQYGSSHLTFFVCSAIVLRLFSAAQQNIFLQKKILFHLIKMLSLISLFLRFPSYFPQNSG